MNKRSGDCRRKEEDDETQGADPPRHGGAKGDDPNRIKKNMRPT